ncbi:hypothetical protein M3484_23295 [Pseudomonas sp. GX19020]|uniref:hypothetical protein n=1 Tax=Pseudomonas sp. GX19020 TaxID=2942277 RepID=UPI002018943E|nr:hypothetical protein [Pseudomonas sp. GX19020]MCL4069485.1 hypothetical protein [Pseudomonas sp. GX19020]
MSIEITRENGRFHFSYRRHLLVLVAMAFIGAGLSGLLGPWWLPILLFTYISTFNFPKLWSWGEVNGIKEANDDALGAKGEARFKELCEDAGLIANKAGRGMMGWDYIVEHPLEEDDDLPLVRRVQGCVCRIQIKTIWERDAGRVSLSLSACEVLAKTADPALICTFVVNDELEFTSASLIHIFDDKLARVLKRLRVASTEVDGKGLNEREITFGAADAGEVFKLTGKALKARLAEICGADPKEYRQKKEKQLTDLGYEERARYELKTKFQVSSHEEIVDFLLGKKPIELLEAQSIDNRFGVPIPTSQISVKAGTRATLTLRPASTVECRIRVRPAGGKGTPATFRGALKPRLFVRSLSSIRRSFFEQAYFILKWVTNRLPSPLMVMRSTPASSIWMSGAMCFGLYDTSDKEHCWWRL